MLHTVTVFVLRVVVVVTTEVGDDDDDDDDDDDESFAEVFVLPILMVLNDKGFLMWRILGVCVCC
jgi:hypothetical protein